MADSTTPALVLPPLNDALRDILGRPNFMCIQPAALLRAGGAEIAHSAEAEQAAVLYWMLTKYAEHGADWRQHAHAEMDAIARRLAAQDETL